MILVDTADTECPAIRLLATYNLSAGGWLIAVETLPSGGDNWRDAVPRGRFGHRE